jgi:hypothetical protein
MQEAYNGKVSLTVASALAPNWLEAHWLWLLKESNN